MCVAISRLPGSGVQSGIAHLSAGRGTWTHGTRFWRPLLYQLSYARVKQKPQGGSPILTASDDSIIARLSITFYHKFGHCISVTPANVLVFVVHLHSDILPTLAE